MEHGHLEQGRDLLGASKRARMQARRRSPQKAMFSRLGGHPLLSGFLFPLSFSLFFIACIRVPPFPVPFFFLLLAWTAFPGYGNVYFTFLVSCWAIPLECWQCRFTFLLCVIALCMMLYIYICLRVCGWSCTLYDGLSWLCERPFLVMRALDLWHECVLKAFVAGANSCHTVCIIIAVRHVSTCLMLWGA